MERMDKRKRLEEIESKLNFSDINFLSKIISEKIFEDIEIAIEKNESNIKAVKYQANDFDVDGATDKETESFYNEVKQSLDYFRNKVSVLSEFLINTDKKFIHDSVESLFKKKKYYVGDFQNADSIIVVKSYTKENKIECIKAVYKFVDNCELLEAKKIVENKEKIYGRKEDVTSLYNHLCAMKCEVEYLVRVDPSKPWDSIDVFNK